MLHGPSRRSQLDRIDSGPVGPPLARRWRVGVARWDLGHFAHAERPSTEQLRVGTPQRGTDVASWAEVAHTGAYPTDPEQ